LPQDFKYDLYIISFKAEYPW